MDRECVLSVGGSFFLEEEMGFDKTITLTQLVKVKTRHYGRSKLCEYTRK